MKRIMIRCAGKDQMTVKDVLLSYDAPTRRTVRAGCGALCAEHKIKRLRF